MNNPLSSRLWDNIAAYLTVGGISILVVGSLLVCYCTQLAKRAFGISKRIRRRKIYYANPLHEVTYFLEKANHDPHHESAYMTAYGRNIEPGDLIILREGKATVNYWVKEIEYYSSPSDLWTALIVRCW